MKIDMKDLAERLLSGGKDKDRKVVRREPLRREWQQYLDDLKTTKQRVAEAFEHIMQLKEEHDRAHKHFWNRVEVDLDCFHDMEFNAETNEIEIFECCEDQV